MFDTALFGKMAGIVAFAAYVPYIVSIVRGKTEPNRATWLIWTIVGFMLAISYYYSGAVETMWVPVIYVIGPCSIFVLSFKYGKSEWVLIDTFCLFGVAVSLLLWWLSGSALVALLLNLFIDFLGAVPTVRKVYYEPQTEDRLAWVLSCAGSLINLFAIEDWTFSIAVYPIYMCIGNGVITALIFIGRICAKRVA